MISPASPTSWRKIKKKVGVSRQETVIYIDTRYPTTQEEA